MSAAVVFWELFIFTCGVIVAGCMYVVVSELYKDYRADRKLRPETPDA